MEKRIYLYQVWVRVWHLINALSILVLIVTGISLQYSEPGTGFIRFDKAVAIHNIFGIIILLNYLFFIIGNLVTSNGKQYMIKWKGFSTELIAQFKYYIFGIFRKENHPFEINESRKFNPLQKLAYTLIMYIGVPILIITGLGLMYPEIIFVKQIFNFSSILFTDLIHIVIGFIVSIFLVAHLYLCTIGDKFYSNFKSIISGWHVSNH